MRIVFNLNHIIGTILYFILAGTLVYLNYTQTLPIVNSNNIFCDNMYLKGYFSLHDLSAHINCTIGLRVGPDECDWIENIIFDKEEKLHCFNFEKYNTLCEFDDEGYGTRCVWGGTGYFTFLLTFAIWAATLVFMTFGFYELFHSIEIEGKDERNKIDIDNPSV